MSGILLAAVVLVLYASNTKAEETKFHFTVRPMPAPRPALRYQLLPELRELSSGNAAQNYLKCFAEQRNFFYGKDAVSDRARYLTMPLAELPAQNLGDYGGAALRQADWAARQDSVDWQELGRLQAGGLDELPPGIGPLQILAMALQVRFRAEVADRRFDDAVRTGKTMFGLARHLGEHPSEAANRVGLWIARLGLDTLREMVQQPGCPNLYWALTDLPCPLVDLRKGIQGESALIDAELRVLRDDVPMSEAELEPFVSHFCGLMSFAREQAGRPPESLRPKLEAGVRDEKTVHTARRRLIEAGQAEARVNGFSPLQIILLDDKRAYEIERDERRKLLGLPVWQIDSRERGEPEGRPAGGLFVDLLPAIVELRRSQAEIEQQIALLRHVEALRLYAADHHGQLAKQMSEVRVPLPLDPITGRPFGYAAEGATAHLSGGSLPSGRPRFEHQLRYEVVMKK
jgi:hypothetical protein